MPDDRNDALQRFRSRLKADRDASKKTVFQRFRAWIAIGASATLFLITVVGFLKGTSRVINLAAHVSADEMDIPFSFDKTDPRIVMLKLDRHFLVLNNSGNRNVTISSLRLIFDKSADESISKCDHSASIDGIVQIFEFESDPLVVTANSALTKELLLNRAYANRRVPIILGDELAKADKLVFFLCLWIEYAADDDVHVSQWPLSRTILYRDEHRPSSNENFAIMRRPQKLIQRTKLSFF